MGNVAARNRGIGAALAMVLAVGSVGFVASPAAGAVASFSVVKVSDGEDGPDYGLDDSTSNGVVTTNALVVWNWDLSLNQTSEATFTQELPECWAWNVDSLAQFDTTTPTGLTVSHVLDGTKLTVTISASEAGLATISFDGVSAYPTSNCAPGERYQPTITTDDDGIVSVLELEELTLASQYRLEMAKSRLGGATPLHRGEYDFGSGAEPATGIGFRVTLYPPGSPHNLGMAFPKLGEPALITDTFTLPTGVTKSAVVLTSARYVTAELVASTTTSATFSLTDVPVITGESDAPYVRFEYVIWLPDSQLPEAGTTYGVLTNSVAADFRNIDGANVLEPSTDNNSASGSYQAKGFGSGSSSRDDKRNYVWVGEGAPDYTINPGTDGNDWYWARYDAVVPGSAMESWLHYAPTYQDGRTEKLATLDLCDFWDPAKQQLTANPIYLGHGDTPIQASEYDDLTIYYTNNGDAASPGTATWYPSIAAAGGLARVNGVRISFAGLQMPDVPFGGEDTLRQIDAGIPFKIVAKEGEETFNTYLRQSETTSGIKSGKSRSASVPVRETVLRITKGAEPEAISSGGSTTYTIDPTLTAALGGDSAVPGLEVVDEVGPGFTHIDVADLDPAWEAEIDGDVDGWTVVFRYKGNAATGTTNDPPNIVYHATSSFKAPVDETIKNRAVISASDNNSPEAERYAEDTVVVTQSLVSGLVKSASTPNEIDLDETTITWDLNWFNFEDAAETDNDFYDILPKDGEARGSSFSGSLELADLELYGDATTGAEVKVTTDSDLSNADLLGANWVWPTEVDLADVTAVFVHVPFLAEGYDGGLTLTAEVAGNQAGDTYINNAIRHEDFVEVGTTNTVLVEVYASTISGQVWHDTNADGQRGPNEPPVPGARVEIAGVSDNGMTMEKATQTGADGSYTLTQLPSGTYQVSVDSRLPRSNSPSRTLVTTQLIPTSTAAATLKSGLKTIRS